MEKLLFFYSVQGEKYQQFILPFIYFANKYNPNSFFEIAIINDKINSLINNAIQENIFPNLLLYSDKSNLDALHYRFIMEPKIKSKFVYIGDIDICIVEDILPFHLNQCQISNSCYSNTERINKPIKMSGLHFVKSNEWYSITKKSRDVFKQKPKLNCNEATLKNIIIDSGLPVLKQPRPAHGVHISLNRKPFKQKSEMCVQLESVYANEFFKTISEEKFIYLMNFCPNFKNTLCIFLKFIANKYYEYIDKLPLYWKNCIDSL